MNIKLTALRGKSAMLAGAGVAALSFAAFSAPAYAQVANCTDLDSDGVCDEAATTNVGDSAADSGSIVVTGSRIRRPELVGLEPTTSISDQYYEDRNITNVADALNELPQFRGSITPSGTQGSYGNGVNFINTFGLGSNRTLTLVNGRRVVSSNVPSLFGPTGAPGTQVDLNMIPTVLIDRIDAVSVGGAPVYGSDAIAGTVNILLRDKYDGLTLNAQSGITSRGDGFNFNISGLAGKDFAEGRGNLTVAMSYDEVEGIRGNARRSYTDEVGFLRNCTGNTVPAGVINPALGCNKSATDGVPPRVLFRNVASPYLSPTGVILELFNFRQFGPDGNLIDVVPVSNLDGFFGTTGDQRPNTYITSDQVQITSDLKRFSTWLFGSYELTEGMELFAEGAYYNANARELGQSPAFNTFVFDPGVSGGLTFDTATTPFLTPSARAELLGYGIDEFNLSRSNEDLIDQSARSQTELKRGIVGVRGEFGALGRDLNYEASFNYGTVQIRNTSEQINQQNFINAVSVGRDANGNPVCTVNPTVPVAPSQAIQPIADPNCRPLNLFGFRVASPEALDYITENTLEVANLRQMVFNANVGGSLFDLWAGPVGFNVGYEHRDEKASFVPSDFAAAGRGRGSAVTGTAGQYNLDELFGEILVPLASPENNIPFLYNAEVFARGRYVDNTVNGGFTAFAFGGQLSPIRDITFRGNFTRSFRSPAITELFLPQSPLKVQIIDACRASAIATGPAPATRTANCTAFLQATNNNPATYVLFAANASTDAITGGNPNLQNEKADSYTFGTIIRPRFIPGLTITADYVNIDITGPITQLDEDDLVTGCFDNPDFDTSDPLNGNQFCTALGFAANGQIPNDEANPRVKTGFINGLSYQFEAVTGTLDFVTGLSGLGLGGQLNLGADALYLIRRFDDPIGVSAQVSDGLVGDPWVSVQGRVRYSEDNWGFGTYANFTGRQIASVNNRGPNPNDTRQFDHYDPFVTIDANVYFKTDDNFRFNFSVTNLFDRIGQQYFGYYIPAAVDDEFGRRFKVSVTKEF